MKQTTTAKGTYAAPVCEAIAIEAENLIADTITTNGEDKDTNAARGARGYTWGEVKRNTVDWSEAQ